MKLKKTAIVANIKKTGIEKTVNQMKSFFAERGIDAVTVFLSGTAEDDCLNAPDVDFAVSLGGDGTLLSCAGIFTEKHIPILAVNMGTFGYLTEISLSEYQEVFDQFLSGKARIVERMRLRAEVERQGKTVYENSALNEFTLSSAYRARIARFNIEIDKTHAADLRADGIIFATPSGSTAYNLSAGGPVLDADVKSIIINPVCPFTMGIRSLVVSENSVVSVSVPEQRASVLLTCDGHDVFSLEAGDNVRIGKNGTPSYFVKNGMRNFIEVLRDKLGWAGGLNA